MVFGEHEAAKPSELVAHLGEMDLQTHMLGAV
jgi:hypothetical protein